MDIGCNMHKNLEALRKIYYNKAIKLKRNKKMVKAICSIIEYLAYAHAITGDFGAQGRSASEIKYYVNG